MHRRRNVTLPTSLACAFVLASLVLEAQTGAGYKTVVGWMKLPAGFILGTPQGAPSPQEMAAMQASGSFPGGISAFAGVAVDNQDRVYAFHRGQEKLKDRFPPDTRTGEHPLVVFDASGKFLRWAGDGITGGVLGPHFIDVDPDDNVWIIERDGHRILKLNKDLETVALQFGVAGESGEDEKHLNLPTDVAWSTNGDIFITDGYGNHRVLKFSKDGKFIKQWGGGPATKGSADGQFNLPHGIVIDWQDRLYVLDRENSRVQIFDTEGKFLGKWTDVGYNWGIAIKRDGGRDGFAYLTNKGTETVIKVSMADGKIVERWGGPGREPGQFDGAHDIAVDSTGAVYVADTWGQRTQKFVAGKLVATLGGRGRGDRPTWVHALPAAPLVRPQRPGAILIEE